MIVKWYLDASGDSSPQHSFVPRTLTKDDPACHECGLYRSHPVHAYQENPRGMVCIYQDCEQEARFGDYCEEHKL